MELRQLHYLSVCAETKSFTKAANVLYTAQSNVSKVIRSLEEELGFELFERRQYGIALTPAGRQVYEQAQLTLGSARKIMEYARTGQRQELRVCTNPGIWVEDAFVAYYQAHAREDVHYSLMTSGTGGMIERLSRGMDQIGFVYVLETQLPLLQSRLEKEHLFCTMLAKTTLVMYTGEPSGDGQPFSSQTGTGRPGGSESGSGRLKPTALVQSYEDEFALHTFRGEGRGGKEDIPAYRVAVTTNSEYVMSSLREEAGLGTICAGDPCCGRASDTQKDMAVEDAGFSGEAVLFGYITRNDRNPDPLTIHFLNFIKQFLKKTDADEQGMEHQKDA